MSKIAYGKGMVAVESYPLPPCLVCNKTISLNSNKPKDTCTLSREIIPLFVEKAKVDQLMVFTIH